jgi:hypothetical protein
MQPFSVYACAHHPLGEVAVLPAEWGGRMRTEAESIAEFYTEDTHERPTSE